jgi:hypothetical protein
MTMMAVPTMKIIKLAAGVGACRAFRRVNEAVRDVASMIGIFAPTNDSCIPTKAAVPIL